MEELMKKILLALGCTLFISSLSYADNCEQVKAQIAEKIEANGVAVFTLNAVEKGTATEGKVVGVCGGGTKDIIYIRGVAPEKAQQTTEQE